jgi:hypothetical protein
MGTWWDSSALRPRERDEKEAREQRERKRSCEPQRAPKEEGTAWKDLRRTARNETSRKTLRKRKIIDKEGPYSVCWNHQRLVARRRRRLNDTAAARLKKNTSKEAVSTQRDDRRRQCNDVKQERFVIGHTLEVPAAARIIESLRRNTAGEPTRGCEQHREHKWSSRKDISRKR